MLYGHVFRVESAVERIWSTMVPTFANKGYHMVQSLETGIEADYNTILVQRGFSWYKTAY